jgi:hypothetical protein
MAHYKADVWLGSNSGLQTVEVNSNTFAGAQDQICTIYNVDKTQIRNLRQTTTDSHSFKPDGTVSLVALIIFIWAFVSFTPYILMTSFGIGSGWIMTKITAGSTERLLETKNKKKYYTTLIVALFFGGFGLILGDHIKNEYFSNTTPTHIQ